MFHFDARLLILCFLLATEPDGTWQDAYFLPGFLCNTEDVSILQRLREELAEEGHGYGHKGLHDGHLLY